MGYSMIEISHDKVENLTENIEKGLRYIGKAMQCIEELQEEQGMMGKRMGERMGSRMGNRGGGNMGMREDDEEPEGRMGMRRGMGMRGGMGYRDPMFY